jgi:WD40 repeat protein
MIEGHRGDLLSVAWSPDGQRLASASQDGTIRIWTRDGTPGPVLEGHTHSVQCVAWRPDGGQLASSGSDKTVRLWDPDGTPGPVLEGHVGGVQCVAWSPDSQWVASGALYDSSVRLWKPDGTAGPVLRQPNGGLAISWHPDGSRIATAGQDRTMRLWEVDGTPGLVLQGHRDWVPSVAWSPNGQWIASSADDGTLFVWDADRGKPRWLALLPGQEGALVLSPEGRILHADCQVVEGAFVYLVEAADGSMKTLSPSKFHKRFPDVGAPEEMTVGPDEAQGAEAEATAPVEAEESRRSSCATKKGTGLICRNGPEGASHKLAPSPFFAEIDRALTFDANGIRDCGHAGLSAG